MELRDLAQELATAARAIQELSGERDTLDVAVRTAAALVRGCTAAGLFELDGTRVHTTAATSDLVLRSDQLQRDLGEGPCLTAIRDQTVVLGADLTSEQRWPSWTGAVAHEMGLRSVLSVPLHTGQQGHGALNLYSTAPGAFDEHDQAAAVALGAQIAMAMTTVRREEHLARAVQGRTVIGQAQGILMERHGLDADTAFAFLVRISQQSNTKLHTIAETLVETRQSPADLMARPSVRGTEAG